MIQRSFNQTDPTYSSQRSVEQSNGSAQSRVATVTHGVSSTFHPHARLTSLYDSQQDTVLCSSDGVFFYVHRRHLRASANSFASLLNDNIQHTAINTIVLRESSAIVDCFLLLVYGFSCRPSRPSFDILSLAFDAVHKYGFSLPMLMPPHSELFHDLLQAADSDPLRVYTLAARYSHEALAVAASAKTLSMNITDVTLHMASEMGSSYLLRLTRLHAERKEAFKQLMLDAPDVHPDMPGCSAEEQSSVMRAYALAAAYLVWEVTPAVGNEWIVSGLSPLLGRIDCLACRQNMQRRIDIVFERWARVPSTI